MEKKGITGSTLKLIGMLSMCIDHTAYVLLGPVLAEHMAGSWEELYFVYQVGRGVIGRMAFPIFCFLLAEGFERTHNRTAYAGRLFLFALLSEIPFDLAFSRRLMDLKSQNVFFTLLLGILLLLAVKEAEERLAHRLLRWAGIGAAFLLCALGAELIACDYGAWGIIAIFLFYLFRKNKGEQLLAGCVAFSWEPAAWLALLPIAFYNGKRGMKLKYVFYGFYPAHLLLLFGLQKIM